MDNRFLYIATRRVNLLPDGASMPDEVVEDLGEKVRKVLEIARQIGQMKRDEDAADMWRKLYEELSDEIPGLLGTVTARAEAQVLRFSMVYALLDGSEIIRPPHLLAAVAVWQYAFQSAAWIFGDKVGDPLADDILKTLRTGGSLTRDNIYQMWTKNRGKEVVEEAPRKLLVAGLATVEEDPKTNGRPAEIWKAK